jgi:ArsR family transcriptional regulator
MAQGSPVVDAAKAPTDGRVSRDVVYSAVSVLKAVGHPLRFRIVDLLAARSALSVTELCGLLGTKQPIVSQQLSILRRGRVVRGYRNGNRVLYSLASAKVGDIVRMLVDDHDLSRSRDGERDPGEIRH